MVKKLAKVILISCLSVGLTTASFAQRQTGSIKGKVTDNEGKVLPGATVIVASEALMGKRSYVTTETGFFRFPALPPGHYRITAEMSGFKTVIREDIVVRVGMVFTVNITMEMTTIEEEVTVIAASPVVDMAQTKVAVIMDKDLLKNIPMARDIYDIVNSAPGSISEGDPYRRLSSIHGGTVRSNTFSLDGVIMNDPAVMYPLTNISFDVMDEVEMITAAHPAEVGYTDGAHISVVTPSGGNKFSGGTTIYYTDDRFVQHLWTDEQIQALGVSKPGVDKSWIDGSLSLGGPILTDKLWFFSNVRYIKQTLSTNFIPFTDPILGRYHGPYDWTHEEKMGFIKLTSQLASRIKLTGSFYLVDIYRPMWETPSPRGSFFVSSTMDHEKDYIGNAFLNYNLDQNTFFDIRMGYISRLMPMRLQEEARDLPGIVNSGTLYGYVTPTGSNTNYLRNKFHTGAYFTRFQDDFLGASHEIKGGLEFEDASVSTDKWRRDNLNWYWFRNSPYYFGKNTWNDVPDVGKGFIYFQIIGSDEGSSKQKNKGRRIGAYFQDSITFADRLTLNLGLRYDRSWSWHPETTKAISGNPVSVYVGENYIKPYTASRYPNTFPDGINPFGELNYGVSKDIMVWSAWSPRIGLIYDVFGDGKTALKASFSRYTEYMMIQYFAQHHPLKSGPTYFYWYDMNFNQQVDTGDDFELYPYDYRPLDPAFAVERIDPYVNSPTNDEFTVGLWHELFKNFSLGVNFISKDKKNIFEDALYAPDTDEWWYHINQGAAQKYWVPFEATVPSEDYGDQKVTFYVRKADAPDLFYRASNLPELKRKYRALEFIFNKRMAKGWQLAGSVVYSKAYGHIGAWYAETYGWSDYGDTPNEFVNAYGRTGNDRPLQIKLMGTVQLPYNIFLSGYYRFFSGGPWVRSGYILPPLSWCEANNAYRDYYWVNLENRSEPRRYRSRNVLDLRLEKEFRISRFGVIGAYIDALNVLGWSGVSVGMNDVLYYFPVAENDNSGNVTESSSYKLISSVSGVRQLKFSLRFSF
jgi:hypothetical protein